MDYTILSKNAVCGRLYVRCNYLENTTFNVFNARRCGNANTLAANVLVIFQIIPSSIYMLAFNKFPVKDL